MNIRIDAGINTDIDAGIEAGGPFNSTIMLVLVPPQAGTMLQVFWLVCPAAPKIKSNKTDWFRDATRQHGRTRSHERCGKEEEPLPPGKPNFPADQTINTPRPGIVNGARGVLGEKLFTR